MASQGFTLSKNGVQVALFPSQQINITQGTNTNYSHAYTKNTDNACDSDKRKLYAPFDVKCVSNLHAQGYGLVCYQSVNPVHTPLGIKDVSMWLMHDNNASQWQVGKIYKQGEHFYTEGDADPSGLTTGIHVHLEVAFGHVTNRIKSNPEGFYHIVDQVYIDDVFYTNGTPVISENASGMFKGDHTFKFKEFTGGEVVPTPKNELIKLLLITKNTNVGGNLMEMQVVEQRGIVARTRSVRDVKSITVTGSKVNLWKNGKVLDYITPDKFGGSLTYKVKSVNVVNGDFYIDTDSHKDVIISPYDVSSVAFWVIVLMLQDQNYPQSNN